MTEEILGFNKKDASFVTDKKTGNYSNREYGEPFTDYVVKFEKCFPAVSKKEHDNKVEDMRGTINIKAGQITVLELALAKKTKDLKVLDYWKYEAKNWRKHWKDSQKDWNAAGRDLELVCNNRVKKLEQQLAEKEKDIKYLKLKFELKAVPPFDLLHERQLEEKDKQIAELKAELKLKIEKEY